MLGLRNSTLLCGCVVVLVIISSVISQDTSTTSSSRRKGGRNRIHHKKPLNETDRREKGENDTGLLAAGDGDGVVDLEDKDKYYEDAEYEYEEADDVESEDEDKFIEKTSSGIVLDHVDFVLLRLKHISMRTSSNITEILAVQAEEFKVNTLYSQGWATATKLYNESKREKIFNNTSSSSIVREVPPEYHIAIIAYTLGEPSMYSEFNKDTREVCSGTDIDKYQWKSYFKLLQLAVETLGSQIDRWRDNRRFLYRGASGDFVLKEGQVLAFQHFISTSAALVSAENFAGKTLFEFEGFYNGTAMAIWEHSFYEHEEEVLFSPVQVFRVDSIHVGTHYTRYVLRKHELLSPNCNNQQSTPKTDIENVELNSNWLRAYSSSSSKSIYYGQKSFPVFMTSLLVSISISTKLFLNL